MPFPPLDQIINEEGKRYGKLQVLGLDHVTEKGKAYWECVCDCGETTVVLGTKLRNGHTRSCGCTRRIKMGIIGRAYKGMKWLRRDKKPSITYEAALKSFTP